MTLRLHSPAFRDGEEIPPRYTADGEDASIPIRWAGAPPGTAELALVMDDPDAPSRQPWVHWILYHIPPQLGELSAGIERTKSLPGRAGLMQGQNSWGRHNLGYRGPAPPEGSGPHRYRLRLYALDDQLDLPPGVDKHTLLIHMDKHILGQAQLTGTYQRKRPAG